MARSAAYRRRPPTRNTAGFTEKDHALGRSFQRVDVVEPSVAETIEILFGLGRASRNITAFSMRTAGACSTELAARHINERHLPDKAIDVV